MIRRLRVKLPAQAVDPRFRGDDQIRKRPANAGRTIGIIYADQVS